MFKYLLKLEVYVKRKTKKRRVNTGSSQSIECIVKETDNGELRVGNRWYK